MAAHGLPTHGRRKPTCRLGSSLFITTSALVFSTTAALAQSAWSQALRDSTPTTITAEELAALSSVLGIILFATLASVLFVRTRDKLKQLELSTDEHERDLKAQLDRAEALVRADAQALIVWPADGGRPAVHVSNNDVSAIPVDQVDILAAGRWLDAASAGDIEAAITRLRDWGEAFDLTLKTKSGRFVEAEGRTGGGQVAVRFRDIDTLQQAEAQLRRENEDLKRVAADFAAIADGLPEPAWVVDSDNQLVYANTAYADAVGVASADGAVSSGTRLLERDSPEDDALIGDLGTIALTAARNPRHYRIRAMRSGRGVAYLAHDVDEIEEAQRTLAAVEAAHSHTLAQLKTGVAALDADRRLVFYNPAFQELWQIDSSVLADRPGFGEILDQLRAAGRLPEVSKDYRVWREGLLFRNRAAEPSDTQWHLPDGRTLRVIIDPQPDGGLTYLFENVTESIDLQTRFVALSRVQRETIDSLLEGIAVFGSDGRLKLHNPTWMAQWALDEQTVSARPHIDEIAAACARLHDDDDLWRTLKGAVTGVADARRPVNTTIERRDGVDLDMSLVPLPDGGTLIIYADVTDSRRVERALRDSNEVLRQAAQIKNDFVHKVSYELRSPLTNIIGFTQLLSDTTSGSLNERQREYTGYVLSSSSALLAIVNDILDLATIDAGVMELEIEQVDIAASIDGAAEGLRDRLDEQGIGLSIHVAPEIGPIEADEKRLRQILFNLLSNAIGFSESGQQVTVTVDRDGNEIEVAVADQGRGIAPEQLEHVFDRFQSETGGTQHRGVGLGLNMVRSLVELHGGSVSLKSEPGHGTRVTCRLPIEYPGTAASWDDGESASDALIAAEQAAAHDKAGEQGLQSQQS